MKFTLLVSLILTNSIYPQIDYALAEHYFEEAAELCEVEGGQLWGVSLCGPMYFADVTSDTFLTNQKNVPDTPSLGT